MTIDQKKYKLLIVEDETFLSKILMERLIDEGFQQVDVAGNGEEALQKMTANPPALVLLDMILPRLNGFEVLQAMQLNPTLKAIPVIVLSNLGQDQDIQQAKQLGAVDYIIKSNFSMQNVITKIYAVLH